MSLSSAPAEDSIGALYHQLPDSKAHMSKLLDGKVAIVTGASREIGAAMAELLAMHGCAVLAAHFGETDRAEALAERLRALGGRVLTHNADLSQVEANQALIARAVDAFGRVDILAANAGLTISGPFSPQPKNSGTPCSI